QRAVLSLYGELAGHIVTVSILDNRSTSDVDRVCTRISTLGFSAQPLHGVGLSIHHEGSCLKAADRLLRAVVLLGAAVGHHRDLILGVTIGHRQRAFVL